MTSYILIVVSLFIPLLCTIYAKIVGKGYSNRTPREFLDALEGSAKRAHHAQNNFYETFPAFAVGVLAAHQLNVPETTIAQLAIIYVVARVLYAVFYIIDNHVLRTISWFIAFVAIIRLYLSGI